MASVPGAFAVGGTGHDLSCPYRLSLPINAEFLDPSSPGFLQVLILKNLVLLEVV